MHILVPNVIFFFEKTQKTFAFHLIEKIDSFTILLGGGIQI
jgi:hypothetical protein